MAEYDAMGVVDFSYLLGTLLAGILATAGYAVIALTPADFKIAKRCFTAAALIILGIVVMWGGTTPFQNAFARVSIAALIGAGVTVALCETIRWVNSREFALDKEKPISEQIVKAEDKKTPKNTGEIAIPTETIFDAPNRYSSRVVEIGNSGSIFKFTGPIGEPIFNFNKADQLTLELINEKLKLSTTVRNRNGVLVAEIIRNEWKVASAPITWDRNYNENAVEVRDDTGRIVLQVRYIKGRIQIQGEWWQDPINGMALVESFDPKKPGGLIIIFGPKFGREEAPKIKPIFKYPSDAHLGELVETSN
jgi:hypothetical protein